VPSWGDLSRASADGHVAAADTRPVAGGDFGLKTHAVQGIFRPFLGAMEGKSVPDTLKKLRLQGFNNLTKTLSFNIYDVCYADSAEQRAAYIAYIDDAYNAARLTGILTDVADIIGANILNIAHQDYEPQGASVTMLISEESVAAEHISNKAYPGPLPDAVVGHLDKSHVTAHTYPETNSSGISTFRADIDVSTCGRISPLRALNYLIHSFESDIVILDYRVRGFTRDVAGRKHFFDHNISSIQNYLSRDTKERYQAVDVNVYQENIFHTKMAVREFRLDDYLFCIEEKDLEERERRRIHKLVRREVAEIFYGRNLARNLEF
jgi:S-adenosylmethionine decarboxylase